MNSLKGAFPFRLGTTSYIRPADLLPNAEFLRTLVDDIELVLFESDEISNLPDEPTIKALAAIARENGLTYTVHLPMDIDPASGDPQVRERSASKCVRVMKLTAPLDPFAFILHLYAPGAARFSSAECDSWRDRATDTVSSLLAQSGVNPALICVETLDFDFSLAEPVVREHGLSICLDIGHLWRCGFSVEEYLRRYLGDTRVVHLHGVRDGKDHLDLSVLPPDTLADVISVMEDASSRPRVVTIEIFGESDLKGSLRALAAHRSRRTHSNAEGLA